MFFKMGLLYNCIEFNMNGKLIKFRNFWVSLSLYVAFDMEKTILTLCVCVCVCVCVCDIS